MGRRRQRHFNPATAGCHVALDARFGVTLIGGDVSVWAGRSGTNFDGSTYGYPGTPVQSPQPSTMNGQSTLYFDGADYVFLYTRPRSLPGPVIPFEGSIFICGKLTSTNLGYQRLLSSNPDTVGFFGCVYSTLNSYTGAKVATFIGNGSSWNDTSENTPIVDAQLPFAGALRREYDATVSGNRMTPTVNTVAQAQKVDSAYAMTADIVGAGPSGITPQFWNGHVAMIAFGPKLSLGMDRRILQMMGRVWRIHTL